MENNCNYSDNWQPYINDYDKFEYDVKLKDGTIIENCYPNGGKFNSISDLHSEQSFDESEVLEIRFSENPRFGINENVSAIPQYEYLDRVNKPFVLHNPYPLKGYNEGREFICKGKHQYKKVVKENLVEWICQCGRKTTD